MNIRSATLEDLESVHQIETLSFDDGSYPPFVLRQFFDISHEYFLVAEDEGKILGYVLGNINKNTSQGWVLSLGVHPESRGKKLGKLLTEKLVELLENDLSTEICLTVHPDNTMAKKIYENLGFKAVKTFDNYYNDLEARLLMKKQLITLRFNA
ncbi:GNAT family N-acetyltransferase [Gelidibacter maritimus]|uniref:GNAT family N-acetyltransferase n=1 Tax=Gelidibacter maritimus TaxID=2761487 RepID=A0A7W2R224_9FLAO|nr:N-acetyltransferase [Gelidibacter maritimus]MBA6151334.1 GNAT family N-acetyltransferase [Gelidibacter maritimus]